MRKKLKLFMGLAGLLCASACIPNKFDVVPSEMPRKALPNVLLKLEGDEPGVMLSFRAALRAQLASRDIDIKVAPESLQEPGAILTIGLKSEPGRYNAYREGTVQYFAPVRTLTLDVEITEAGRTQPYLSMNIIMISTIFGASKLGYERIERLDELVHRAARLLSQVYLNALGGSPEPIEGEWINALEGSEEIAFGKDPDGQRYSGVTIHSLTLNDNTLVYRVGSDTVLGTDRHKRTGGYKVKYLLGSQEWLPADFFVYGCLMMVDPKSNGEFVGKSFWVKKNGERCSAD